MILVAVVVGPVDMWIGPQSYPHIHRRRALARRQQSDGGCLRRRRQDLGQGLGAEVAPGHLPFVVLLEEHRADEPGHGGGVGEDTYHVGAAFHLLVQAFEGIVTPDSAASARPGRRCRPARPLRRPPAGSPGGESASGSCRPPAATARGRLRHRLAGY